MEKLKEVIKWFGKMPIFIYGILMLLGNVAMTIIVTELSLGLTPLLVFNGIMVSSFVLGILSKYIK